MTTAIYDELKGMLLLPERPTRDGMIWSFCPVHEGDGKHHKRSLSLHPDIGLKCWAGCTEGSSGFKQVVDALYSRAGVQNNGKLNGHKADGPSYDNEVPRRIREKHPRAKLIRAYEYRDPYTEELLAVKARIEWPDLNKSKGYDKTFLWRLPDGSYDAGLRGKYTMAAMPLYCAEKVVAQPKARVWVVEGEECVHRLQSLGEVAVSVPSGSSQKSFDGTLDFLRDRDVFLVPDNDEGGQDLMALIRYELSRVGARSIRHFPLPVPPKGDIIDYLNDGGDIDSLVAGQIEEATIEVVSNDRFIARVPAANGKVYAFDCSGVTYSSRELNCELAVTNVPVGKREVPFVRRVNLLSASAVDGIARTLAEFYATGKEANWTAVVNTVVSLVSAARKGMSRAKRLDELSTETGVVWLIDDIIPDSSPIVMFGDGESCKTWCAYSLGLAVAMGSHNWNGHRVQRHGGVLVVDYETNERQMRARFARLLAGIDEPEERINDLDIYWWNTDSVPLVEQADAIAEFCKERQVRLVIIDAAADAVGGEPEKADVTLQYFNGLNRIQSLSRAATLSIAHITHAASNNPEFKPVSAFGSRFWRNRPRMTWRVEKSETASPLAMNVALTNTKFNDGPRPGPYAFRIEFVDPEGQVSVEKADYRGEFVQQMGSVKQQIMDVLRHSGAMTISELHIQTGLNVDSIKNTLWRAHKEGQVYKFPPEDGERENRWGIAARHSD